MNRALAFSSLVLLIVLAFVFPAVFVVAFFATVSAFGWAACKLAGFAPPVPAIGKPAMWFLLGTVLLTQAVFFLSLAFGYSQMTVLAVLFIALSLVAIEIKKSRFRKSDFRLWVSESKKHAPALIFAAATFALVFFILSYSVLRPVPGGFSISGWNWSDFLVHYGIISSINAGNFPPQNPFVSGAPLYYDYFCDFNAAIAAMASGGQSSAALFSVFLQSGLLAACLLLLVYSLGLMVFRGNKKAAFFAAVLAVLGGGLGYVRLAGDAMAGKGAVLDLISSQSYDNNWSADAILFQIPSVLGTGLLVHRSSMFGLPFFALAVLLLLSKSSLRGRAIFGAVCALAAPFRYFTFAAIGIFAASVFLPYAIQFAKSKRSKRRGRKDRDALLDIPAFLALFSLGALWLLPLFAGNSSKLNLVFGWEVAPKDSLLSFFVFYFANLGVPLALGLLGFAFLKFERKMELALAALLLFLLPNIVSFVAISWDMNKFFQFLAILLAIPAGAALSKPPRWLCAILVFLSVLSPLFCASWFLLSNQMALSNGQMAAAQWIEKNTPQMSVFATTPGINSPTDFAGRLRIMTFPPYSDNFGIKPDARVADLRTIFCGSPADAASLLRKYRAEYIVDGWVNPPCNYSFRNSLLFEKVFSSDATIYQMR